MQFAAAELGNSSATGLMAALSILASGNETAYPGVLSVANGGDVSTILANAGWIVGYGTAFRCDCLCVRFNAAGGGF